MNAFNREMIKLQELASEAGGALTDVYNSIESLSSTRQTLQEIGLVAEEDPSLQPLLDLEALLDDVWAGVVAAESVWTVIEDNKIPE